MMLYKGLFYVIDGFLDVSLPQDEPVNEDEQPSRSKERPSSTSSKPSSSSNKPHQKAKPSFSASGSSSRGGRRTESAKSRGGQGPSSEGKHLFTVKPGGIAGYLGASRYLLERESVIHNPAASLSNTASYVDIKAKTDAYVGFLPAASLERLIEKSPIVLLTLAKRLISLLSPLGKYHCVHCACFRL